MATFQIYDLIVAIDDDLLTPSIERGLSKGWYERDEVDIARLRLSPRDRVIELGSGLGVTTMVAARIVGSEGVHAYEGNPRLVDLAKRNAAMNGLAPSFENTILFPRALAPASATAGFNIAEEFWASSILHDGAWDQKTIAVPISTLEDEILNHHANVLIMDIEGMEVEILEAADLSLVEKMIFEIHYESRGKGRTDRAILGLLQQGFAIDFKLCSRGVLYLERVGQAPCL